MALDRLSQVTSSGLASPINIGIATLTSTVVGSAVTINSSGIDVAGIVTATTANFVNATISGDLTVEGTTTTLDTILTEVDKLEVGANNTTVGVAITQSGTGDILRLYDGASRVVTVKDGGSVGIGTDNPNNTLVISKPNNHGITLKREGVINPGNVTFNVNSFGAASLTAENNIEYTAGSSGSHRFFNLSNELVRIKSDGNVGIGTDNPLGQLTLYQTNNNVYTSTIRNYEFLSIQNKSTTSGSRVGLEMQVDGVGNASVANISAIDAGSGSADLAIGLRNSNVYQEKVRITSGGSVGIGTDNPGSKLHIISTNNVPLRVQSPTADSYINFVNSQNTNGYIGYETQALTFYTNNTEKLRITSTGDVGIGTTNPDKKLRVEGDARITGTLTMGTASIEIAGDSEFPTTRPTLDLNFAATKTLDRRITFTRDSIGTYTDELGIIQTAPNNVPRFDHDPDTGESLGLLIEESRTNLVTYSENFGAGFWTKTDVSLSQTASAPDGTNNATIVTRNSTSYGTVFIIRYSQSVTTGQSYTFSAFVKAGTYNGGINIALDSSGTGGYPFGGESKTLTVNLSTGARISGITSGYTITSYPDGWYRISVSGTATANGTIEYSVNSSTPALNEYFYVWGVQLEQGSFPTSYIPTSGSTVTRAADLAKITGTNFTDFYNQSEGTFFAEADTINPVYNDGITGHDNNNNNYTILGTGQSPNRFQLRFDNEDPFQVLAYGPNSTSATSNVSLTPSLRVKIAGTVKQDDVRGVAQGEIILTDTSFDMISPTALYLGNLDGSNEILPGHIRRVSYYRQALTNAQLQSLTRQ